MAEYYVKNSGDDEAAGTSDGTAWETVPRANAEVLSAGDVVQFARGSVFTGTTLYVGSTENGADGNPITFRDYGTGSLPLFTPPNATGYQDNAMFTNGSDWITFLNLAATGAKESGVRFYGASQHCVAVGCEVDDSGYGVTIDDDYNTVRDSYIHDLIMAVNTADPGTDDRGATGVRIYGANNLVELNRFYNCIAPSYDYEYDGGGVEFYGPNVDSNLILRNWFEMCCGVLEVGSGSGGTMSNNVFAYNIVKDCGRLWFHLVDGSTFPVDVVNFRVDNNTFYETGANPKTGTQYWIGFNGTPDGSDVLAKGNIVVLKSADYLVSNKNTFVHTYNTYYLTDSAGLGSLSLDATEDSEDPKHTNPDEDDFTLQASSPCIDAGTDLSYSEDYVGNVVPYPALGDPDRGAFEWWPSTKVGRGIGRGVMRGVGRGL